jgi:hypothetical protein
MSVSPSTTLFSQQLDAGRQPAPFLFSLFLHALAGALITWGLIDSPRIDAHAAAERLLVRSIELNAIEQTRRSDPPEKYYPVINPQTGAPGSGSAPLPVATLRKLHAEPGPQTIIQPDLTRHITLPQKLELPQVILWSPSRAVVKQLVPPPPQKPAATEVKPAFDLPTEEANLGSLSISSSPIDSQSHMPLPSSSSPVEVQTAEKTPNIPMSQGQTDAQPTPAAVVAISDERMSGIATLPPVNESAGSDDNGELKPGNAATPSQPSNSSSEGVAGAKMAGSGAEKDAGEGTEKVVGKGAGKTSDDAEKAGAGNRTPSPGAGNRTAAATDESAAKPSAGHSPLGISTGKTASTRFSRPRDGQFNAVVIGDDLSDMYPETDDVWSGRMAYTVYLHVGLARSWILQYSRSREDDAAEAGVVSRLVAPWPYDIVRPDLAPGAIDADALMVRGFIDESGHFDSMHIVFPADFKDSEFVLKSLAQWQFRPAEENGAAVRVEILLVIPNDEE